MAFRSSTRTSTRRQPTRPPLFPATPRVAPPASTIGNAAMRWMIYIHRWLGIAGCLLFIAWFISGIAMMYHRMPFVSTDERAFHAEPLDASAVRITPADAAQRAKVRSPNGVELGMLLGRPVYRFPGRAPVGVFADDGTTVGDVTKDDAMRVAAEWSPPSTATARYEQTLTISDQWTLQARQHLPIHKIALGDAADTRLYISSKSGEVVVDANRRERVWGYIGPVMHWLYLPVIRRNGPAWTQVILWTSGVGCVMCIAGLVVGVLRFSPRARFRQRQGGVRTPYIGLMKWHHYAGLVFGVITLTWTFSGLMSMGPFELFSEGPPPEALRDVLVGKPDFARVGVPEVQAAAVAIASGFAAKTMMLSGFRGTPYWMSDAAPESLFIHPRTTTQNSPRAHRVISAIDPAAGPFARFENAVIERVARDAMPGVPIADATWLTQYDNHYLHRTGERSIPVYRVRYADARETWIYFDPLRGTAPLVLRPKERLDRWLYQGLHSLSWPAFYFRRPLWDVVTIVLMLGGLALGITTLTPAWQRVRRRTRGLVRQFTAREEL